MFLLAGVSYYKTGGAARDRAAATPAVTRPSARSCAAFYLDGLGEFAYRNGLDLTGLRIEAPTLDAGRRPASAGRAAGAAAGPVRRRHRLDRHRRAGRGRCADAALFVVNRPGDRFDAIERPAAVDRAARWCGPSASIDPQVLRSRELGFLNGHVPVTGIISAIAVHGRRARRPGRGGHVERVVGVGRQRRGRRAHGQPPVVEEPGVRGRLPGGAGRRRWAGAVDYSPLLRPYTELLDRASASPGSTGTTDAFRSCNRAFHIDPARCGSTTGAGECDKCCFIDLILAPFVTGRRRSPHVFGGREPLDDPSLLAPVRALVGTSGDAKPWECVGDVGECRGRGAAGRRAGPTAADTPGAARRSPTGSATACRRPDAVDAPAAPRRRPLRARCAMRPTLSWSDLAGRAGRRLGPGRRGRPTSRKLAELGVDAGAGRRPRRPPAGSTAGPSSPRPTAGSTALARCDVVVKTPGISRYRPEVAALAARGIAGGRRARACGWPRPTAPGCVCITGTKGKSTTTAIAGHLLARLGHRVLVGGNLGLPPYDPAAAGPTPTLGGRGVELPGHRRGRRRRRSWR